MSDAFRNGTALFVCYGSYQPDLCRELGDASCIILFTATGRRVRGVLRSTKKEANAYRSALTGIYGGLDFIMEVCHLHGVTNIRAQVGCDNDKELFLSYTKVQRV